MSLRHALLGLLTAQPMTGYDLAKVFDRSVEYVWHAPHSQIYPELRRMEADGLIAAEPSFRGRRPKRVYAITADGRRELERWVAEPSAPERVRDPQRLKTTYLEFASYDDARRHFRAHLEHYETWRRRWATHVDQLADKDTPLIRRRLATPGTGDPRAIVAYKVHAYRGMVRQAELEVQWAQEGLDLVDELEAEAAKPAPARGTRRSSG